MGASHTVYRTGTGKSHNTHAWAGNSIARSYRHSLGFQRGQNV
jgi:hypothetical protein